MGTQQSRSGPGRQGTEQQSQQDQRAEGQQSQLGGHRDLTHRMENEGREQQDVRGQQSQQNVHGEGNYAASRQYDEATKQYVQAGRVDAAARAAAPNSEAEAREMDAAEAEGKRRAKGEDPALNRRGSASSVESSQSSNTPRPGHEEE
jgi:hypothetical protein